MLVVCIQTSLGGTTTAMTDKLFDWILYSILCYKRIIISYVLVAYIYIHNTPWNEFTNKSWYKTKVRVFITSTLNISNKQLMCCFCSGTSAKPNVLYALRGTWLNSQLTEEGFLSGSLIPHGRNALNNRTVHEAWYLLAFTWQVLLNVEINL